MLFVLKMNSNKVVFSAVVAALCMGVSTLASQRDVDFNGKTRIVGGKDAPEGAYPYMVSIRKYQEQISLKDSKGLIHTCGGSIIAPTIILTAAHCVFKKWAQSLDVVAGTTKPDSGGTKYTVKEIILHEKYNDSSAHDIALLRLSSAIEYTSKVAPIKLETAHIGPNVTVTVTGWGMLSYPVPVYTKTLQYIHLKTISNAQCIELHESPVRDANICTLSKEGEGTCYGDSGSPLVANGRQIGIVSWSYGCGIGFPVVYIRVSSYIDWIRKHSK